MSSRDRGGQNAETGQSAVDVETLISLAVHASPVGMLVVDDRGVILFANREAERHFGFSVENLAGLPVESLVPGPAGLRHASLRQSFIERPESHRMGPGRYLLGRRQDGSEFPIEVGLNPVQRGRPHVRPGLGGGHHGAAECRNRGAPWCRRIGWPSRRSSPISRRRSSTSRRIPSTRPSPKPCNALARRSTSTAPSCGCARKAATISTPRSAGPGRACR